MRCDYLMHVSFFFFNDPAPTEIYTLSLHDALPISARRRTWAASSVPSALVEAATKTSTASWKRSTSVRSEEHTSELQSRSDVVCRLLLEKKNTRGDERLASCYHTPSAARDLLRDPG